MQLISVYLFPNKLDVFTNSLAESWKTERYRQVYQRNLKLFRGVDNDIDIHVKTSDQKPQNITGSYILFNLVGTETQELLLQKTADVRSATLGKLTFTITADDLLGIEPGFYNYSIVQETRDNIDSTEYTVTSRSILFLDSQYGTQGIIEVNKNVFGETKPSLVIKTFREDIAQEGNDPTVYYSSIIDANPNLSTESTVHTFRFYMTDYDGEVVIQGSQSEGANPQVWTDISTYEVVGSDLSYATVTGKYNWLRIKHTPGKITSVAEFVVAQTILGDYTVSIRSPGSGYQVGDTVSISGSRLGGSTPTNDLVITVSSVSDAGAIVSFTHTGTSYNGVRTFVLSADSTPSGTIDKILYR